MRSSNVSKNMHRLSARCLNGSALAPNVELVGKLQEGGFEDQQWLIQRDGHFVQLTELLYRILEQAKNGERSIPRDLSS